MDIEKKEFGQTSEGLRVFAYTLSGRGSLKATFTNYGCALQSLVFEGADGPVDVVLGYDDIESYEKAGGSFGAFVGRYANRIKGAAFELDGRVWQLEKNSGENHLHGCFSKQVYEAEQGADELVFRRVSPAGEDGFPGTVDVEVRCRVDDEDGLHLVYIARTDAPTVINLTNHSYFNLAGKGDVLSHELRLACGSFTENGEDGAPTGRILPVEGTPLDFREWKKIGRDIGSSHEQITLCGGYDHNMIIDGGSGAERCAMPDRGPVRGTPGAQPLAEKAASLRPFAWLRCAESGILMEALTTQPGAQLFSGNNTANKNIPPGKGGVRYPFRAGVCLETQNYPCAPNHPHFPSSVLRPGEVYRHETVYRFFRI